MPRIYCPEGKHYPAEALVTVDGCELPIIAYNDGRISNRWADGTVGIPEPIREAADADESPYCAEHHCYCTWEHGKKKRRR